MKNDSKHTLDHDNNPLNTDTNLNIDKPHKRWYEQNMTGKQRSKPKSTPPESKKRKKDWK